MKKYLQITVVLTIFGTLVFLRQVSGKENTPAAVVSNKALIPTPTNAPITTPIPTASSQPIPVMMKQSMMGQYKNGIYTGSTADAFYGNLQVQAVITSGKISNVVFLQYPNDNDTSRSINGQAMPLLIQEAIQVQNAQVDIISGASASSQAFQQSLTDALSQAR